MRVAIDRDTGDYESFRRWTGRARRASSRSPRARSRSPRPQERKPDIKLGDFIEEPLEPIEFGRIGAQTAKQVILQKIRDAEREQILNDFLARERRRCVTGTVKRMERGNAIIESGRLEARAAARPDDPEGKPARRRPRARLRLRRSTAQARGPAADPVAHRAGVHHEAVRARSARDRGRPARDQGGGARPGHRAPRSRCIRNDPRIDPIGTCVGMRGSRVQAVTQELAGERVDIVLWSADPAQFVINALAPAEVSSILVDEEKHAMDVVVDEENLAHGDRPQRPERAPRLRAHRLAAQPHDASKSREKKQRGGERPRRARCSWRSSTSTRKSPTS